MPRYSRRRRARARAAYRRRASRWGRMVAYRRKAAVGLSGSWFMSVVKAPTILMNFPAGSYISKTLRLCPLGYPGVSGIDYFQTVFQSDERFTSMCMIYNQFRIREITWIVRSCQSSYAGSNGKFVFVARGIRNCNKETANTTFVTSAGRVMNTPGIIYRSTSDVYHYPSLVYRLRARSILEKTQWYSTGYTALGESQDWANHVVTNWAPALDVAMMVSGTLSSAESHSVEVIIRMNIDFRDACADPDDTASLTIDRKMNLLAALKNAEGESPAFGGGVDDVLDDAATDGKK